MKTYIIALLLILTLIVGCSSNTTPEVDTDVTSDMNENTEPIITVESGSDISENEFITDDETEIGDII